MAADEKERTDMKSGRVRIDAEQSADRRDIVTLLSEYVNLPQSAASGNHPTIMAFCRFIQSVERDGAKFDWDAAESAVAELCPDGRMCTLNQFRAVYHRRAKSASGVAGCESCDRTGVVNIVIYRDIEDKIRIITDTVPAMAYVGTTPCRCPKGRVIQDGLYKICNRTADYAYSKRMPRNRCIRLAADCTQAYRQKRGIKEYVNRGAKKDVVKSALSSAIDSFVPSSGYDSDIQMGEVPRFTVDYDEEF